MQVIRSTHVMFVLATICLAGALRPGPAFGLDSSRGHSTPNLQASGGLNAAATDGAWTQPLLEGRRAPGVVYDPVRDRMIVFGGEVRGDASSSYYNDVWVLSLSGTVGWSPLATTGTPPSARAELSAIYDPGTDRILVFGGTDGVTFQNDVWALSLAGPVAWTHLSPGGTPPSARAGQTAIYDGTRNRMLVFGGYNAGGTRFNDVKALSLGASPTWSTLTLANPPAARSGHTAIYDAAGDRMVVFGGYSGASRYNDVWALSLAGTPAWAQLTPSGAPPSMRQGVAAIYDPAGGRMLMFGGDDGSTETWSLSLGASPTWSQLFPSSTTLLRKRAFGVAFYDPVRFRMMVFGGNRGMNDVMSLSLTGALAWSPVGGPNGGRFGPMVVFDTERDRMVLFGGYDGTFAYNDVWALNIGATSVWTSISTSGMPPSGRSAEGSRSAFYDAVNDRMIVFGGNSGSSSDPVLLNDLWALSFGDNSWSQLAPTGGPPVARQGYASSFDSANNRIVIFAGNRGTFDAPILLDDVWTLSLGSSPGSVPVWTQLSPTGPAPAAREFMSSIYDPVRNRMVLFGGTDGSSVFNTVWALSLGGTPAWTILATTGTAPSARFGSASDYDPLRDRILFFGGYDGVSMLGDTWALGLAGTPTWSAPTPTGTPPGPRMVAAALYDSARDRMLFYGGDVMSAAPGGLWSLGWAAQTGVDDGHAQVSLAGLRPPVPNPTHGTTALSYFLAQGGRVQLGVYDVSGRLVRQLVDGERRAGSETVTWDATDESGTRLGAGVYFVRLSSPGLRQTRRLVILR